MKKTLKKLLWSLGVLALAHQADAQIKMLTGGISTASGPNPSLGVTVGAVPAISTSVTYYVNGGSSLTTSFTNGSTVSALTSVTGTCSSSYWGDDLCRVETPGYNLTNASGLATITGGAYIQREFTVSGWVNDSATVSILGPTLNNYGLVGATNFTWTARLSYGPRARSYYTWSGTGESSFYITAAQAAQSAADGGALQVFVTPTYYYENGKVMVQVQH